MTAHEDEYWALRRLYDTPLPTWPQVNGDLVVFAVRQFGRVGALAEVMGSELTGCDRWAQVRAGWFDDADEILEHGDGLLAYLGTAEGALAGEAPGTLHAAVGHSTAAAYGIASVYRRGTPADTSTMRHIAEHVRRTDAVLGTVNAGDVPIREQRCAANDEGWDEFVEWKRTVAHYKHLAVLTGQTKLRKWCEAG